MDSANQRFWLLEYTGFYVSFTPCPNTLTFVEEGSNSGQGFLTTGEFKMRYLCKRHQTYWDVYDNEHIYIYKRIDGKYVATWHDNNDTPVAIEVCNDPSVISKRLNPKAYVERLTEDAQQQWKVIDEYDYPKDGVIY